MKAITLIKYGKAGRAFETKEVPEPTLSDNNVLIKVDAFGLNYADVMARKGLYKDAPPIPCVLGYEVVGKIEQVGKDVNNFSAGQRVVAFTRFGGYAGYAVTDHRALVIIPEEMENGVAVALATQYCTAYYCAYEMVNLDEGDRVLVHAAAGGVGIAIIQLAKRKGCIIYGTAGSDEKLEFLKEQGVNHPINYRRSDFAGEIMKIRKGEGMDVIFDSVGGTTFNKSKKILASGGRMVCYGAAERSGGRGGILSDLRLAFSYGFLHPLGLLMKSQGVIGVNMLRIADNHPHVMQRCFKNVVDLTIRGEIKPHVGGVYNVREIADAHNFLESRRSIGKIVVEW
ncbi:MAG: zinc-binding dehydrogenase [Bacteroidota bacterium]